MAQVEVSIIVPTLNEAENLPLLCAGVAQALRGRTWEMIVVDDGSTDNTVGVCEQLSHRHPLRLSVRSAARDGLSGAVLAGMNQARGEYLVVMDADLQHPPASIPQLLDVLETGRGDFALGSRYAPGGTTEEHWGVLRRVNSRVATALARPFAGSVRDPMSGFFALRRSAYKQARHLTPLGYKIALELMCKCRVQRVVEVPIHFATRTHGQSKLCVREQFRYLEHLSRLYDYTFPRLSPWAKFLIVTAIGWFVGLGLTLTLAHTGIALWLGVALGYAGVIGTTAVFHGRYVRTQRDLLVGPNPWRAFAAISLTEWTLATLAAAWLCANLRAPTLLNVLILSFGCALVVRYVMRKELLQDLRGLRRGLRYEEAFADRPASAIPASPTAATPARQAA